MLRRLGPSPGGGGVGNGGTYRFDKLAIGSTPVPGDNLFLLSETVTENPALGQTGTVETNVIAGDSGDYSAFRVVLREMTAGNNQVRPLEVHMLRTSGLGNQPTQGIELTIQGNVAETIPAFWHNALRISSLASTWGIASGKRQGNGIFIGQDENGFENGFLYRSTAAEGNLDLFVVSKVGQIKSGEHVSRTSDTYALGASNSRWSALYTNFILTEQNTNFATPYLTSRGDNDTGLSWPGGNRLVASANAVAVGEFNVAGIQSEQSIVGKHGAVVTPPAGYSALAPSAANTWVTKDPAGNAATLVTTAHIATGAAVGTGTPTSTASTTFVDLTDMSVTLTGVVAGSDILVWFSGTFSHGSASGASYIAASLDGAAEVGELLTLAPVTIGNQFLMVSAWRFPNVAAGNRVVKIRYRTASGTLTAFGAVRSMQALAILS